MAVPEKSELLVKVAGFNKSALKSPFLSYKINKHILIFMSISTILSIHRLYTTVKEMKLVETPFTRKSEIIIK